jgi:hypothetical protein
MRGKGGEGPVKAAAILLFPLLSFGDVTNVKVLGTTATQAVLTYTAPDTNACTVAVSSSPSLTPLAYDVDPALFSGANSDARAGNITSGRLRTFVIGKRTVETDLSGTNRSRALEADTPYYFQIACSSDSSSANGTFTTATIPSGLGYGDPIPIDPTNNGNYIFPSISATDRTASIIDPHTGALVKNMTLASDIRGQTAPGMTYDSFGAMCHPQAVKASDENKYGYHCQLMTQNNVPVLYWIASDGETRLLGVMNVPYVAKGWNSAFYCYTGVEAPFDHNDPNTFYCRVTGNDSADGITGTNILKAVYSGHGVPGQDGDTTNVKVSTSGMAHTTYTPMFPWGRTLETLLPEFDPNYVQYGSCCAPYNAVHYINGKIVFTLYSGQNYLGWLAVYDPAQTAAMQIAKFGSAAGCIDNPAVTGTQYTGQAGCFVASTGTFTGQALSGMRWMTLHAFNATDASPLLSMMLDTLGAAGLTTRYRVTLTSGLPASATPCTMAKPANNPIPDWPDTSWVKGCSTITVTGEPSIYNPLSGWPISLPALPGDLLSVNSGLPGSWEAVRLLDKGPDGLTWYVQRQTIHGGPVYSPVAANGTMDMMAPTVMAFAGVTTYWDYINGAKATDGTTTLSDTVLPPMHGSFINNSLYGRWSAVTEYAMQGMEPERLLHSPPLLTMGWPGFNGSPSDIWQLGMDSHPALSISDPPDALTYAQVVDCHPYEGNTRVVTASTASAVGGQLYQIRGTNIASTYKLYPYFANSGSHAMKEVSGPSVRLATDSTTQFQWCVALNAGECYAGSLAGDVYFNAPGITVNSCNNNYVNLQNRVTLPNDICISPLTTMVQSVRMQKLAQDPFGLGTRALMTSLSKYEGESDFWNARTIPDGSWVFVPLAMDGTTKLIKVPRQQTDTVNRTAYVPVSVSAPARAGVDNVIVEFGYADNGDPTRYYCTARQEACVAQNGTIDPKTPFYYLTTEAASIKGAACQSGCTVTIPAVSGRVLYYRVDFRDATGTIVDQQVRVQTVP